MAGENFMEILRIVLQLLVFVLGQQRQWFSESCCRSVAASTGIGLDEPMQKQVSKRPEEEVPLEILVLFILPIISTVRIQDAYTFIFLSC